MFNNLSVGRKNVGSRFDGSIEQSRCKEEKEEACKARAATITNLMLLTSCSNYCAYCKSENKSGFKIRNKYIVQQS
jgi:hypothetical protein